MEQISKNKVIELIKKYKEMAVPRWDERYTDGYSGVALLSKLLKEIEQMETSESRPTGEWIEHKNNLDTYYCSKCETNALYYFGKPFGEYRVFQVKSEFCPCCGAEMRGKE